MKAAAPSPANRLADWRPARWVSGASGGPPGWAACSASCWDRVCISSDAPAAAAPAAFPDCWASPPTPQTGGQSAWAGCPAWPTYGFQLAVPWTPPVAVAAWLARRTHHAPDSTRRCSGRHRRSDTYHMIRSPARRKNRQYLRSNFIEIQLTSLFPSQPALPLPPPLQRRPLPPLPRHPPYSCSLSFALKRLFSRSHSSRSDQISRRRCSFSRRRRLISDWPGM